MVFRATSNGPLDQIEDEYLYLFLAVGFFGVLTIVTDYLQYLAGYFSVDHAIQRAEAAYAYNISRPAYRLRALFFWLKQAFAAPGAADLMLSIVAKTWA